MRHPAFAFWRFSVRTYGRPGVGAACLALQDECGADVNLLLYCAWLGRNGRRLTPRALRSAIAAVARWQAEVVQPLRCARRALGSDARGAAGAGAKALREPIAALELDAEYVEQRMLAAHARTLAPSPCRRRAPDAAAANLQSYVELIDASIAPRHARHLMTIVDACFPNTRTRGARP